MPIHRSENHPLRIFSDDTLSLEAKGLFAVLEFDSSYDGKINTREMEQSWIAPLKELIEKGYVFEGDA